MKTRICCAFWVALLCAPTTVYADFWGADLPLLTTIIANTADQVTKMQTLLGTSAESLELMQDINRGIHDAISIVKSQNSTLDAGVLSDLSNADQLLTQIQKLYGEIPDTSQAVPQATTDKTVAQSIHLHNEAFRYADRLDPEIERLKSSAQSASPGSAQKLTAHSIGVLIHATNQVLRTNAAILKVQSEQLALQNRQEKLNSENLRASYIDTAKAYNSFKPNYSLPKLK